MKSHKPYISIYFYLFLCISIHLSAQDSLEKYLEMAAKNNPEIKAAFNQYLASLEKVPQVGSLPDPQATFGYYIKPMEQLGGNQLGNIQVMQMFPWFGTLKAAKDEASMMAKAKFESFNASKTELYYQVKSSWYRLMKYDREIALVKENVELLESLEKLALIKFQSPVADASGSNSSQTGSMVNVAEGTMNNISSSMGGANNQPGSSKSMPAGNASSAGMQGGMNSRQSGLQDVLRVKMEILEQQSKLALLNDQRRTEQVGFNALLNRNLDELVLISDSLIAQQFSVNKLAIGDSILNNNPMLAMIENEAGSYSYMEQKAKKMGLPMFGIGLNYMLINEREGNTAMMNGKDMIMPMVSVSIPIYRKKYSAMKNEARLMQEVNNQQLADLKNSLLVQYRLIVQNLDDAERRIALYQEQEELAKKTTDLLLSEFTTTGNNYEEVLRMQMKVLDYGFKLVEAIVDYNTTLAMAEKLMNSVNV